MLHNSLHNTKIVLASASPRRKELLQLIGLKFITMPAHIDESISEKDHTNPKKYVKRIAIAKCEEVKRQVDEDCLVIAADTIVYHDKKIFGKPTDDTEAFAYLRYLSGNTHIVYTGLALSYKGRVVYDTSKTYVTFCELSDSEINNYIQTAEPMDKAGAYGIQGYGSQFISKINGCYFNVMGFPVNLFYNIVGAISVSPAPVGVTLAVTRNVGAISVSPAPVGVTLAVTRNVGAISVSPAQKRVTPTDH